VHPEVFELDKQARKCQIENVSLGGKVANHAPLAIESPISEYPVCRDAAYTISLAVNSKANLRNPLDPALSLDKITSRKM
jgi:hypothetical protein